MTEESPYTYLDRTYLEGQLLATQTVLNLLLKAHVFHSDKMPSGTEVSDEVEQAWRKITDELRSPAQDGFHDTMRWFDMNLAGGSPFSKGGLEQQES